MGSIIVNIVSYFTPICSQKTVRLLLAVTCSPTEKLTVPNKEQSLETFLLLKNTTRYLNIVDTYLGDA